jgi:hypothetical protein
MPELGPYGSVRGAVGNSRPYRKRRNAKLIHALRRPASEKSAKARNRGVLGTDGAAGAMGIWPRRFSVVGVIAAAGPVAFPQTIGAGWGVNE